VVCLIIHDNQGCAADVCHEVVIEEVQGECHAQFEWEVDGLVVHFINQSTSGGEIISYQWNFGDGHMGDGQNPNHTYEQPGEYLVCLIIHDNQGCVSDVCHEIVIEEVQGECHAQFEWEVDGLVVHFINQSTSGGEIISYQWNFGDGHMGDGQNPNHTYEHPGVYVVCLIIHDNQGCAADVCHEVVIEEVQGECHAQFEWDADDQNDLTIHFTDLSTSDGVIGFWHWTFGDGSESDDQNPSHTYDEPGTYTVCLVIMDEDEGCASDVCHVLSFSPQDIHNDGQPQLGVAAAESSANPDESDNPTALSRHLINFPNPFVKSTTILYWLSEDAEVSIDLYDAQGRKIRRVLNEFQGSGYHKQPLTSDGLISGLYFVKLTTGDKSFGRTISVLRD
jgi:PKD repeat protein